MKPERRTALTFIECLIILAIVLILIGLLIPARRNVREASQRMNCQNSIKQIVLALDQYHAVHGRFPKGCHGVGDDAEQHLSWMLEIVPFTDKTEVPSWVDPQKTYSEQDERLKKYSMSLFLCDRSESIPVTHYTAMSGVGADAASRPVNQPGNGFMGHERVTNYGSITDGTSNTIAIMERKSEAGPWLRGWSSTLRSFDPANPPDIKTIHPEVFQVGMVDGSVRSIRVANPNWPNIAAMITIADNDTVHPD